MNVSVYASPSILHIVDSVSRKNLVRHFIVPDYECLVQHLMQRNSTPCSTLTQPELEENQLNVPE